LYIVAAIPVGSRPRPFPGPRGCLSLPRAVPPPRKLHSRAAALSPSSRSASGCWREDIIGIPIACRGVYAAQSAAGQPEWTSLGWADELKPPGGAKRGTIDCPSKLPQSWGARPPMRCARPRPEINIGSHTSGLESVLFLHWQASTACTATNATGRQYLQTRAKD